MRKSVCIAAVVALPAIAFFCNAKGSAGLSENPYGNFYSANVNGMSAPDAVPLDDPAPEKKVAKPIVLAASSKTCSQRCSTTCSTSCTTTRGCSSNCKSQTDGCSGGSNVSQPAAVRPAKVIPQTRTPASVTTGVATNAVNAVSKETGYWLSTTGKRHNKNCRYYKATRGQFCSSDDGTPCGICGG